MKELILIQDFLTKDECQEILDSIATKAAPQLAGLMGKKPNTLVRNAWHLVTTNPPLLTRTVNRIADLVDQFYGIEIEFWSPPQLLHYPPGGLYKPHLDANLKDPDTGEIIKTYHRDYSLSVFLNDNYSGGELAFPKLEVTVQPKIGRIVVFPSDNRFLHTAQIVGEGDRYQMVNWLTAKGSSRNHDPNKHGPLPEFQMRKKP